MASGVADPGIQNLIDSQLKCLSYGGNLKAESVRVPVGMHLGNTRGNIFQEYQIFNDWFEYNPSPDNKNVSPHIFATKVELIKNGAQPSLSYVSLFADEVVLTYVSGEKDVFVKVFDEHYDAQRIHRGHAVKVPFKNLEASSVSVKRLKDIILGLINQRYTSLPSKESVAAFDKAKRELIGSLIGLKV